MESVDLPLMPLMTAAVCLTAAAGCAGTYEDAVHADLATARSTLADTPADVADPDDTPAGARARGATTDIEPGLAGYIAYAMAESPELRAAFERWRASVHRISRARRLPEPTIGFGYFLRSVETRVGPQHARISLQQSFPWPSKLAAGADAASARARALERRFDAMALAVRQRVATAYYRLWLVRETRALHVEHLAVLRALSETVRARLATGAATLADQQRVDLAAARVEDSVLGFGEAERAAAAELRAAMGAPRSVPVTTPDAPADPRLPRAPLDALREAAREHPLIDSFQYLAEAEDEMAEAEAADQLPSFTLGADWIVTGEARMPGVADSSKDAVMISAGMRVPLWQGSYGDSVDAARAEAAARRAEQQAAIFRAMAELEESLSAVRDAARRVALYRGTLVPQADSAYASVLGAYATGRGTVVDMLLVQRDLLDLRVELTRARADYGQSWARLEQVVGRELPSGGPEHE